MCFAKALASVSLNTVWHLLQLYLIRKVLLLSIVSSFYNVNLDRNDRRHQGSLV